MSILALIRCSCDDLLNVHFIESKNNEAIRKFRSCHIGIFIRRFACFG